MAVGIDKKSTHKKKEHVLPSKRIKEENDQRGKEREKESERETKANKETNGRPERWGTSKTPNQKLRAGGAFFLSLSLQPKTGLFVMQQQRPLAAIAWLPKTQGHINCDNKWLSMRENAAACVKKRKKEKAGCEREKKKS